MKTWTVVKILKSFRRVSQEIRSVFWFCKWDKYIREVQLPPSTYIQHPAMNQCLSSSVSQSCVLRTYSVSICCIQYVAKLCLSALNVKHSIMNTWCWQVMLFQVWICGLISNWGLPCLPLEGVQVTATNHHIQFILLSGRRIKLVSHSLALGIAGHMF